MNGWRRARPLLGTLVEITLGDDLPRAEADQAINRAFAAIERVQALMSFHDRESELSRLNREAWLFPVPVSMDTWQVLQTAQELSAASDGVFDITVAPTLEQAGFLPRHADQLPVSMRGSWQDIELLPMRRVRFARRLRIDLGGIAKGFAVDQAIAALQADGIRHASVNAGGDLRVLGTDAQSLHLRHPEHPTQLLPVTATHAATATSAGYFRHRHWVGRERGAIVNTRTRQLCETGRSITVFADRCMIADALTKIVCNDPHRATPLLERHGARALIMEADPDSGECRVFDSAA